MLLAVWNWTQQQSWCYFDTFTSMSLWHLFSTCICPYAVSLMWGVQIFTTGVVGAVVVRARGWIPSVPPADMLSAELEEAQLGQEGKGERHLNMPKYLFLWLALAGCIVIGSGQAVGNNYFWVYTSLDSDTFLGWGGHTKSKIIKLSSGVMVYAGFYLFSKIFASVHVMIRWDDAPPRSAERINMLVQTALIAAFSQLALALGHLITTDKSVLFVGMIGTGYATGAMNSLIVATSLDFYGRRRFVRVFSEIMALAALALITFFNGVDALDMYNNHAWGSDDYYDKYSDTDNLNSTDRYDWGGCWYRPKCIQNSMLVQAVACFAAAFAASSISKQQEQRKNDIEKVDFNATERAWLIEKQNP